MKIFKYVWFTMLVCMVSCLCAVAQNNNKYLVLDQGIAGEVVNKVIDANAKDADSKDKAWAKMLIEEAFKEYFAQAVPEKTIYDQAAIDTLQAQIGRLGKDVKMHKDSTIFFKTKFNEQKKKAEKDKASHKKDLDEYKKKFSKKESIIRDSLSVIINELSVQERCLDSLDNVIAGKDILMASLEKDAQIARNIIDKLNAKQNLVVNYYMGCSNSSIEYVNVDFLNKVNLAVDDYMNYLTLVDLPIEADVREKLNYLKDFVSVGKLRLDVVSFMDSRFDNNQYELLLQRYNALKEAGLNLNDTTRTFYPNMEKELVSLKQSVEHFQKYVLLNLSDQGLMPDAETVDKVKAKINRMIEFYTDGEFMSNDRYYYNSHYKNLNRVVDKAHDTLKEMNKAEYQNYLTQLKDSL